MDMRQIVAPTLWALFVLISLAIGGFAASATPVYKPLVFLGSAASAMFVFMVFGELIYKGILIVLREPPLEPPDPISDNEAICLYIQHVLEHERAQPSAIFAGWPETDRPLHLQAKALLTSAVKPERDEFDQAKVRSLMSELGDIRERIRNESAQEHEG